VRRKSPTPKSHAHTIMIEPGCTACDRVSLRFGGGVKVGGVRVWGDLWIRVAGSRGWDLKGMGVEVRVRGEGLEALAEVSLLGRWNKE